MMSKSVLESSRSLIESANEPSRLNNMLEDIEAGPPRAATVVTNTEEPVLLPLSEALGVLVRELFEILDLDKSRTVDSKELNRVLKQHPKHAK